LNQQTYEKEKTNLFFGLCGKTIAGKEEVKQN